MLAVSIHANGLDTVKNDLRTTSASLSDLSKQPLRSLLQDLAHALESFVQDNFDQQGALTRPWASPSPVTVLLRQSLARRIGSDDELQQRARSARALEDTGQLRDSFRIGGQNNHIEFTPTGISFGSRDPRASRLQDGGATTFPRIFERRGRYYRPVSEQADRFRRNARPRDGSGGYNRWYYRLRAILTNMAGQTYNVPARPIMPEPSNQRLQQRLQPIIERHIENLISHQNPPGGTS